MNTRRGVLAVIGGFLVHLTLGTLYTFGNMSPYMASYLQYNEYPNITSSDLVWINAAVLSGQGMFMSVGGFLEKSLGPMVTTMMGAFTMSAGTILTHFSIDSTVFMLVITYGFLYGAGIGIGYISPLTCGMKWFPRHKGLVNGCIVGGFGMGALIFNLVQTAFLNPRNLSPNDKGIFTQKEILDRVPFVFLLLGAIYTMMQLVGSLLISDPSNEDNETVPLVKAIHTNYASESLETPPLLQSGASAPSEKSPVCPLNHNTRPSEIFRFREFYLLWFTMLLITQTVTFINSMYKSFGQTFIKDDFFLAMVGSICAVFNSVGRVIWGCFVDRFGYKHCMVVECSFTCILISLHSFVPDGGKAGFAIWMWMISVSLAGTFVLVPTCVAHIFGPKYSGPNYGIVFTNAIVSGPVTALLAQHLSESLGFNGLFYLLAGLLAVGLLLTLTFRNKCVKCDHYIH